ncbi:hypothetical protein DNC80_02715 [Flavobacterium sp. SOK18b]|nr:hypothetical protein [Flavobacterium sp. SOK18b]
MISKIEIEEFRNRLKENTKIGSPKIKIPIGFLGIFRNNKKCFYGNFNNSNFVLTSNSNFAPVLYFLKGNFKSAENKLLVNYSVEPVGKLRIAWIKYFPLLMLIMCNYFFYYVVIPPKEVHIVFNIITVLISLFSTWILQIQKKKLRRKFNKIFEII